MNKFLNSVAKTVRGAFTVDPIATRMFEKTYVDVALSSRLWGACYPSAGTGGCFTPRPTCDRLPTPGGLFFCAAMVSYWGRKNP